VQVESLRIFTERGAQLTLDERLTGRVSHIRLYSEAR